MKKKAENRGRKEKNTYRNTDTARETKVEDATGAYSTTGSNLQAGNMNQVKAMNWQYMGKETEPDNKHRVSLGTKIQTPRGVRYKVLANEFGQILLDPVKTVPAHEAWVWENEERIESIRRGIKQAEAGILGTIDLSAYSDDEDEDE